MFELYDLYLIAPELSLTLLALTVMVVDLFVKRLIVTVTVALVGLIIPMGFAISQVFLVGPLLANHTLPTNQAFFGMFIVDQYAMFFDIIFLTIAAVMILSSYSYVGKYVRAGGEFYTLM